MSSLPKFVRVGSTLLNTRHIYKIDTHPEKFIVHTNRFYNNQFILFGSGGMNTNYNEYEIIKHKHPASFALMKDFIDKIPN